MKYTRIVDIAGALAASFLVVIFKGWFDKSSLNPFFSIVFALLLAVASNIFIEAFSKEKKTSCIPERKFYESIKNFR